MRKKLKYICLNRAIIGHPMLGLPIAKLGYNTNTMNQHPPSGIMSALAQGIYDGFLTKSVILALIINLAKAGLDYTSSLIIFWIAESTLTNDIVSVKYWLLIAGICNILSSISQFVLNRINNHIVLNLEQHLAKQYLHIYTSGNKFWLRERKTEVDYNAIKSAVSAVTRTYSQLGQIIGSILTSGSAILIMFTTVGSTGLPVVISMLVILTIGCKFLKDNYETQKEIEKVTNPISTCITFLAKSIFSSVLNGMGSSLVDQMVEKNQEKIILETAQDNKVELKYSCLEIIHDIIVCGTGIWIAAHLEKIVMIVPIYNVINRACYSMWRLFHLFHFTAKISSSWAPIEEIFSTFEYEVETKPLLFDNPIVAINSYMNLELPLDTKEIQLCAESGGGKTTMLTNMAIMFTKVYGDIIGYMAQNVNVINSDNMTILDYFGLNLPSGIIDSHKNELVTIALELAAALNISEKWFNKESISKPLDRTPSGGEEKRIALIQTILLLFLQIKLGLPYKKLLLVDEATSGLDKKNFELVRIKIFKKLVDCGIVMVYIDHHENNDPSIVQIEIIKEEAPTVKKLPEICESTSSTWSALTEVIIGSNDMTDKKYYDQFEVLVRPKIIAKIKTNNR